MDPKTDKRFIAVSKTELDALDDVLDGVCNVMGESMTDCYFENVPQQELFSLHQKVMRKLDIEYSEDQRENLRVIERRERMRKTSSVSSPTIHKKVQR